MSDNILYLMISGQSDNQRGDSHADREAIMATEWRIKAVH